MAAEETQTSGPVAIHYDREFASAQSGAAASMAPVAAASASPDDTALGACRDRVPASSLSRLPALHPQRARAVTIAQAHQADAVYLDCPGIGKSYLLGKTLADCLMGKVKLAQVHSLAADGSRQDQGTAVAIKVMLKSCIRGKVTRDGRRVAENPEEEIQAMMFMGRHPHLLNLEALASDEEHVFLVMELAPGGDLFGRVSLNTNPQGRLAECDAQRYFHQLVLGVQYMHSRGIVHRDLSLENVMLDGNDCLKVIDFGLMKQVGLPAGGPLNGEKVGKGGYMPPEVYRPVRLSDARSVDVWCMGVMLFIMLFGVPPYRTPDAQRCRLYAELASGRLMRLLDHWGMRGHASDAARDLVISMLQPVAADRPTLADILQHPWLRDMHAAGKDSVISGTNHDELIAWMEAATAQAQAQEGAGFLPAATVAAAPGAWGTAWRRQHGVPAAAQAAAGPPIPGGDEYAASPVVLPAAVGSDEGAACGDTGGTVTGLRISAPPRLDEDGDVLG